MYQLTVPYVVRTLSEGGGDFRTPDVPEGWTWEQVSSELDTGKYAARGNRLAIIDVREDRATVEAFMDTLGRAPIRADWTPGRRGLRDRARDDKGALREFRTERRRAANPHIHRRQAAEMARRTASFLLPLVMAYGSAEVARHFGMAEGVLVAVLSPLTGTSTILDDWSTGTDGSIQGSTPQTDPGSGTWDQIAGTDTAAIMNRRTTVSGGVVQITGLNFTAYERLNGSGLPSDQFCIAAMTSDRFRNGVAVRLQNVVATTSAGEFDGYYAGPSNDEIWIWRRDGTVATRASDRGSNPTTAFVLELAVTDSDLVTFTDGLLDTLVGDSTHTGGDPGFWLANNRQNTDWEAGAGVVPFEGTDAFGEADGTEIDGLLLDTGGSVFTVNEGIGKFEVRNNRFKCLAAATSAAWAHASSGSGGPTFVQAALGVAGTNRKSVGVCYEIGHAGNQIRGYSARYMSTTQINVYKNTGSVATFSGLTTLVAGDVIRLEQTWTGTTSVFVEVFVNGSSIGDYTDAAPTAAWAVRGAVMISAEQIEESWDDFEFGKIVSSGPPAFLPEQLGLHPFGVR